VDVRYCPGGGYQYPSVLHGATGSESPYLVEKGERALQRCPHLMAQGSDGLIGDRIVKGMTTTTGNAAQFAQDLG